MKISGVDNVDSWLMRERRLGQSLLTDMRLRTHGYSVEFTFLLIVDGNGRLLKPRPRVSIEIYALQRLELTGGLTEAMVLHRTEINWGLSEVAQIFVSGTASQARLDARWENERHIMAEGRQVYLELQEPAGARHGVDD